MKKQTSHDPAEPQYATPDERRAQGKGQREAVPREVHGHWKPAKDRRDVVDLLNESNEGRMLQLVPIRFGRMMQSPFTFYRGSAAIMAADLASTPVSGIRVQACGDAHLSNFGGFATPERRVVFDINDFDETLLAPWEWDLKRLAASVVVAGRQIRLPESDAARAARATVCSYREHMSDYASLRALEVWYDTIDVDRFLKAMDSPERRDRIRERLESVGKKTYRSSCFPSSSNIAGRRHGSRTIRPSSSIPRPSRHRAWSRATRKRSRFTASRWPSTFGPCSIASISAIWR
jgi:hypothetical protein